MSRLSSAAAEASLINDVEFLEELERQEYQAEPSRPVRESVTYDDALDALETGLPVSSSPRVADVPYFKRAPMPELELPFAAEPERVHTSSFEDEDEREPVESTISFRTAAIVILLCLSVGAASASVVFSAQISRISALVTASR